MADTFVVVLVLNPIKKTNYSSVQKTYATVLLPTPILGGS